MDIDLINSNHQSNDRDNIDTEIRRKTKIISVSSPKRDSKNRRKREKNRKNMVICETEKTEFYWGYCIYIDKEFENNIEWRIGAIYSHQTKYNSICRQIIETDIENIDQVFDDIDCNIKDMVIISTIMLFLSNKIDKSIDDTGGKSLIIGLFNFMIDENSNKIFMEIMYQSRSWLIYTRHQDEKRVAILRKGIVTDDKEDLPTTKSFKIK